ncbi:MAG: aminotransferase class V-fold PLP-dependent enzyme [Synergistaceae bacterium]|nr:aminotransferase class V-fold PLP-dependent enzyme [Synergistaceae bacterium]
MSIYLNNAATTWPKPEETASAMFDFITRDGANLARGSASQRDIRTLDDVYTCRAALAKFLGGYEKHSAKYLTFTSCVTESINVILKGTAKQDMRIVTSSMEHNAVIRPLRSLEEAGAQVEVIQCSMRGYLDPKSVDNALRSHADLAIFSHCSNVSGSLQDLTAIAEVCAKYSTPLVVDSAQTAGIVPIDTEALGLAALCFTGHKGLMGPQGTGGILWRPDFAEKCQPLIEGGTGSFSHEERQPKQLPDKFESGTLNLPGIAGLLASVKWIEETGMSAVSERERILGAKLEEGMLGIDGLRILGPAAEDPRLPVYSINIDGKDNAMLARELSDRFGIETRPGLHCAPLAHRTLGSFPEGALRLSPGYFNTEEDIDITIDALKTLAKR